MYSSPLVTVLRGQAPRNCLKLVLGNNHRLDMLVPLTVQSYSRIRQFHLSTRQMAIDKEKKQKLYPETTRLMKEYAGSIEKLEKAEEDAKTPEERELSTQPEVPAFPEYEVDITKRRYGLSSIPAADVASFTPVGKRLEQKAWVIFAEAGKNSGYNRQSFKEAVATFAESEPHYRRGVTEFIYVGLDEMTRFGAERDLDCYKILLKVFPPGKYVPETSIQSAFDHFPRQQECTRMIMEQMEYHRVCPDDDFGIIIKNRFGVDTKVVRHYRRNMYWMPKWKNLDPYPVPFELPEDNIVLALLALKRMCSYVDKQYKYTVWKTEECEFLDTTEHTFVASAQSPTQRDLLHKHNSKSPLFVEGPFPVWLNKKSQYYFQLRADPNMLGLQKQRELEKELNDDDNLCDWTNFWEDENASASALTPVVSVHEQEDGTTMALAITGSASKESLLSWIRLLSQTNSNLTRTPVLFRISTMAGGLRESGDNRNYQKEQDTS